MFKLSVYWTDRHSSNCNIDEAKKMNISLPGLSLAHQMYIALQSQGHGRKGTQALILALESLSGYDDFKKLEENRLKNCK